MYSAQEQLHEKKKVGLLHFLMILPNVVFQEVQRGVSPVFMSTSHE